MPIDNPTMSGPSSKASFVPSDTRMSGSLRVFVLFWIVYSGSQESARLGVTCPQNSASGPRYTASSAAGHSQDCGLAILDALNHAGIAPDKLLMIDSTVIRAQHYAAGANGVLRK